MVLFSSWRSSPKWWMQVTSKYFMSTRDTLIQSLYGLGGILALAAVFALLSRWQTGVFPDSSHVVPSWLLYGVYLMGFDLRYWGFWYLTTLALIDKTVRGVPLSKAYCANWGLSFFSNFAGALDGRHHDGLHLYLRFYTTPAQLRCQSCQYW